MSIYQQLHQTITLFLPRMLYIDTLSYMHMENIYNNSNNDVIKCVMSYLLRLNC